MAINHLSKQMRSVDYCLPWKLFVQQTRKRGGIFTFKLQVAIQYLANILQNSSGFCNSHTLFAINQSWNASVGIDLEESVWLLLALFKVHQTPIIRCSNLFEQDGQLPPILSCINQAAKSWMWRSLPSICKLYLPWQRGGPNAPLHAGTQRK